MITVKSVNVSDKKGTIKIPVPKVILTENGVEGDAHAGPWTRQVSLLGLESIRKFEQETGRSVSPGEFAENLTTEGMELWKCHPLDRFGHGQVLLEVTQIGKECHGTSCAIFKEVGDCVMPKEGIFARVIGQGTLSPGDFLEFMPKTFRAEVITLSDRAAAGLYEDRSGPRACELLTNFFISQSSLFNIHSSLIADSAQDLSSLLKKAMAEEADIVITTGGTGIGPRDFTPEVVRSLMDKEIPGIMDAIRLKYGAEKPNALLSRSVAGVMGNTLVFALPGSVKAVNEYLEEILRSLMHMIYMLHGLEAHGS
jgi:molybdopterin adenylyltransferase